MIKIKEAVIVEGKYDKIKLSSIIDAPIITTDGFRIFKDKEKQRFIRNLAEKRGILILTDSDSAGLMIRSFLGGTIKKEYIRHAYIPELFGKEKAAVGFDFYIYLFLTYLSITYAKPFTLKSCQNSSRK